MKKFLITFAGVPGSTKSQIASYLSWNLGLPIFSNDVIRGQIAVELGKMDQEAYERRRDECTKRFISAGTSVIYDASIDRAWASRYQKLLDAGYQPFVISMDLSREFIEKLYRGNRLERINEIDEWVADHERFLQAYPGEIGLHITDENFSDRFDLALEAATEWLSNNDMK